MPPHLFLLLSLSLSLLPSLAWAADAETFNWLPVLLVGAFIGLILWIAAKNARHARHIDGFYTAGRRFSGFQNGLALAGDYLSAGSLLGISAAVMMSGFDGLLYSIGWLVGWPLIAFMLADRLRNLGKFTLADVIDFRFSDRRVRLFCAASTLCVIIFYLTAQTVGAGSLISLMLGIDYLWAVLLVGALMLPCVLLGGMAATTWEQIVKTVLLIVGVTLMAFLVLKAHGFSFERLFAAAVTAKESRAILAPGSLIQSPLSAISLGLALMCGTVGLPHILMRFFSVTDAGQARKSVFWATGIIGWFYALTFVIGFGAIVFVSNHPGVVGPEGANLAALHLADALGGNLLFSVMVVAAFATIMAVVSGLALSAAATVAHDLYAMAFKQGEADDHRVLTVVRFSALALAVLTVLLGVLFKGQNVALMVSLAFSIAASTNFPALILSLLWKDCSARGIVIGGGLGLFAALIMTLLSEPVWVGALGHPPHTAPFPFASPVLFSMPLAFFAIVLVSTLDISLKTLEIRERFDAQTVRAETGLDSEPVMAQADEEEDEEDDANAPANPLPIPQPA
ncbi:MAG: sodium/solute symporter [Zoogloeaceae bacterium]|jgi:cation/acetate symporter|nr:sodium/solute symporter [Zoogloeaceae bacterium]